MADNIKGGSCKQQRGIKKRGIITMKRNRCRTRKKNERKEKENTKIREKHE